MDYLIVLIVSLVSNIILMFCLSSPNIIYFFYKGFFRWRNENIPKREFRNIYRENGELPWYYIDENGNERKLK